MEIKLNKDLVQQINSKRFELGVKQQIVMTQEEMVEFLLKKGIETYDPRFREKIRFGVGTTRPGVLCYGVDKTFTLLGALSEPDPKECVRLLKEDDTLLMVIFGEPGCGVTTLIKKIQSLGITDIDIYDDENPNTVNIPRALGAIGNEHKVILAMSARSFDEAEGTLRHYVELIV